MTWVLIAWSAVMLVWIIGGIASRPSKDCLPTDKTCIDASDVGTGLGVGLLIFLWFLGFIVLALVWLMSRPKPS
jgi:hypothetical protein